MKEIRKGDRKVHCFRLSLATLILLVAIYAIGQIVAKEAIDANLIMAAIGAITLIGGAFFGANYGEHQAKAQGEKEETIG